MHDPTARERNDWDPYEFSDDENTDAIVGKLDAWDVASVKKDEQMGENERARKGGRRACHVIRRTVPPSAALWTASSTLITFGTLASIPEQNTRLLILHSCTSIFSQV